MAGHSKWSSIKHKKAATDAKRSKIFTRILKEITVAARLGGGDPTGNPRLRTAIADAKSNNLPNDNIDRAIKKGTGELEGVNLEEVNYEGYGPGGVAVIVETMTDNRNRTVGEVRHCFSRHGGNLGENGCVSWMFDKKGVFVLDGSSVDEEGVMELAMEIDAEDYSQSDEGFELQVAPENYSESLDALSQNDAVKIVFKELSLLPQNTVDLDADTAPQVLRLMDALEELDDVQNVWSNFEIDEEILAGLES